MSEQKNTGLLDENNIAIPAVGFYLLEGKPVSQEEYDELWATFQQAKTKYEDDMRVALALVKAFEEEKGTEGLEG